MIPYLRRFISLERVWKHLASIKNWKKMNENGVTDRDPCKRPHDDDKQENKKLCTDEIKPGTGKPPKRKKFAILLGYNGRNYRGMQINKEIETIELELLKALSQAGVITENESKEVYLTKFQRAARTDKSVSAARQVVSLLMSSKYKCEDINSHLPLDIRVFSIKRVTKHFNSKGNCDARTYSYLLPTQALSQEPMDNFLKTDYRISQESMKEVNDILSLYCGTHSFHNFTNKRHPDDPSCKRYIMSFTCGTPFVQGKEFVMLTVKGQSFMLYQIRKMIGLMLAIRQGLATADIIQTAFLGKELNVPIAPAEGLFLERPHFDNYDRRYGEDGMHEKLTWEDVEDEVMKFREENIISGIIENELKNQVMGNWITGYLLTNEYFRTREERIQNTNEDASSEDKETLQAV